MQHVSIQIRPVCDIITFMICSLCPSERYTLCAYSSTLTYPQYCNLLCCFVSLFNVCVNSLLPRLQLYTFLLMRIRQATNSIQIQIILYNYKHFRSFEYFLKQSFSSSICRFHWCLNVKWMCFWHCDSGFAFEKFQFYFFYAEGMRL